MLPAAAAATSATSASCTPLTAVRPAGWAARRAAEGRAASVRVAVSGGAGVFKTARWRPQPAAPYHCLCRPPHDTCHCNLLQGARGAGGARWWAGGSSPWGGDDEAPLFDLSGGASGLDGSPAPDSEAVTTIFCSDGSIVTLGPQRRHPLQAAERRSARRASIDPLPLPGEQGLCIGRWAWLVGCVGIVQYSS